MIGCELKNNLRPTMETFNIRVTQTSYTISSTVKTDMGANKLFEEYLGTT